MEAICDTDAFVFLCARAVTCCVQKAQQRNFPARSCKLGLSLNMQPGGLSCSSPAVADVWYHAHDWCVVVRVTGSCLVIVLRHRRQVVPTNLPIDSQHEAAQTQTHSAQSGTW
jgi:hypothetical protein